MSQQQRRLDKELFLQNASNDKNAPQWFCSAWRGLARTHIGDELEQLAALHDTRLPIESLYLRQLAAMLKRRTMPEQERDTFLRQAIQSLQTMAASFCEEENDSDSM